MKKFLICMVLATVIFSTCTQAFPYKMNEKHSYVITELFKLEGDDSDIEYEAWDEQENAGEEDMKYIPEDMGYFKTGILNFMHYKEGTYKENGQDKKCYFFIFYFDYGGEDPQFKTEGILVINEAGRPVFIKFLQQSQDGGYNLSYRGERKDGKFISQYTRESKEVPLNETFETKIDDQYYIDEVLLFTFDIYSHFNNPYKNDSFIIKAFIPFTFVIPAKEGSKDVAKLEKFVDSFSFYPEVFFTKEKLVSEEKVMNQFISPELSEIKFVKQGNQKIRAGKKTYQTAKFEAENLGFIIYIDSTGKLIRFETKKRTCTYTGSEEIKK
ncbi:MAG: hypothetical protein PHV06_09015 [bacterium]|nr:hypothetical protein [bacterium]